MSLYVKCLVLAHLIHDVSYSVTAVHYLEYPLSGKKRSFIILPVTKKVQTFESIWTVNSSSIFLFHYVRRRHYHHHHYAVV